MKSFFLFFALMLAPSPVYTPEQADRVLLAIVETEQAVPDDLPAEIGEALARLWVKEELWGRYETLSGLRLKGEIEWTRRTLDQNLPALAELQRLPGADECQRNLVLLSAMREDLNRLAEVAAPWNAEAIAIRRGEIDSADCFFSAALHASRPGQPAEQRQRIAEVRNLLRPAEWITGDWPTVPYWRIERTHP